jgi:hypothetical protein
LSELAGQLEQACELSPDLDLEAEELVERGDVADGAFQAAAVVVVDPAAIMARAPSGATAWTVPLSRVRW